MEGILTLLSIVALLATASQALLWLRAKGAADARRLMSEFRTRLDDISAAGGLNSSQFTDDDGHRERQLEELMGRVNDKQLQNLLGEVLAAWRRTWARAPAPPGPFGYFGDQYVGPSDQEQRTYEGRRQAELEESYRCREKVELAAQRANTLERLLVVKS